MVIANKFYKKKLGYLLRDKPDVTAAVAFYLLYILGIVVFVLNPALGTGKLSYALGHGALLGLAMYATYDLTNQSTVDKWPKVITIIDLIWGTFITTLVSVVTFLILK
ncbi:MAG: conserved rane protein of unknown function [Candidatus Saccharibacteria bacterium]|nr:conserved rane protein of unknown function [Candidatus Saccharibacteria bacterium]